jgi:uncharacterized protein (DUF302 family)
MRNLLIVLISLITINGFAIEPTRAESHPNLSIADADSVDEAVERFTAILEKQGFDIVLIVNHTDAAKSVGLELRPTQVIYARQPRILERLTLKRSDTVGIDLPLKFLVYEDENGEIQDTSNPVGYLVDRHDIKPKDFLLRWLQRRVNQFGKPASGLVTIKSSQSLADTVDSLIAEIESRAGAGFRIPLVLDFTEDDRDRNKHRHRGKLPQQVLIVFGNPNVGTPLMQADQLIGLDLPQEYLVWEHRDGRVHITWNDPFFIAARYNIQGENGRLAAIDAALLAIAEIGADIDPKSDD